MYLIQLQTVRNLVPAVLLFLAVPLFAGKNVAVVEFKSTGASAEERAKVESALESALVNGANLSLVERAKLNRVLREQAFQAMGLTKPEDAIRIGEILNAHFLMTCSLAKTSNGFALTTKVINAENARTISVETTNGDSLEELLENMGELGDTYSGLSTLDLYCPPYRQGDKELVVTQTQKGERFEFAVQARSADSGDVADFSTDHIDATFFSRLDIALSGQPPKISVQFLDSENNKSRAVHLSSLMAKDGLYEIPLALFDLDDDAHYTRIRLVLDEDSSAAFTIKRFEVVP